MDKELTPVIILAIVIIVLISTVHLYTGKTERKCHSLGGVYIEAQCFKAELIKLN